MTVHRMVRSVLSSSVASITVNSIPQWNQDLEIVVLARTDRASNTKSTLGLRFNNDSGNTYSYALANCQDGQAAGLPNASIVWYNPINSTTASSIRQLAVSGATAAANTFGWGKLLIANYTSTSKNKTVMLESANQQGNWISHMYEGVATWNSTSNITSITLFDLNGANLVSGSSITVYGMG